MKLDSQTSLFWSIFLLAFAKYREQTFGRDNYEYFFFVGYHNNDKENNKNRCVQEN